jgi:hypothetical protein
MLPTKWMKPEDGEMHPPPSHPDAAVARGCRAPQHACSHLVWLVTEMQPLPRVQSTPRHLEYRLPHHNELACCLLPARLPKLRKHCPAMKIMINVSTPHLWPPLQQLPSFASSFSAPYHAMFPGLSPCLEYTSRPCCATHVYQARAAGNPIRSRAS